MTLQDAPPSAGWQRELGARELGARELAGYSVLRSLARDEHAEVLLGHRAVPADSPDAAIATVAETVALKVSPASASGWDAALRECGALERARGAHVVELLDLDADETSIRLVFERLPRGDLAELLRLRGRLEAGEAVTLLAPIAVTLLRLHLAGVAHGAVSPRTVLFRDDGSPTLLGFSRAELFEAGAPEVVLERVGAVRRDRSAVRVLAATVLARVAGSRARAARDLLGDVEGCEEELVLPLLASRLFEVAAAMPVRFEADEPEMDAAVSGPRAVPVAAAAVGAGESANGAPSRVAAALARLVPEPLLRRVLSTVERSPAAPFVAAAAESGGRRWRSWTPGRRRILLAVGAAALTVGVLTAVVPTGAGAGSATTSPTAGAATTGTASTGAASGAPGSGSSEPSSAGAPAADPAVAGDDPLAASTALLRARERCLSSLSVLCLDGVDEVGSGALEDDRAAIRTAQQGGELPDPLEGAPGGSAPELVERLGDSALVRLGPPASGVEGAPQRGPASLLLVKGEAGWRIRDVVAADGAAG